MHRVLLFLLTLSLATPAFAVDPECVGATGAPPVYTGCELKMTGVTADLRFCSPQVDIDGDPVLDGALGSCTVSLDGAVVSTIPVTLAGQLFSVTVNGKNLGHRLEAFCTNSDGIDGEVWASDLCFPSGTPGRPHYQE